MPETESFAEISMKRKPKHDQFTNRMKENNPKRIHFMGIGGSACSGIALIAKRQGYVVSGCDLEKDTPYLDKLKKEKIKIGLGHSKNHLENNDLLVVSPAILYQNPNHPEVLYAKKKDILLTWEEFLGRFLQKGKEVICVSGTHGKSTTTAILSLIFEKAGVDPNVILGAKVREWKANFRIGKSEIFITEADEFNDNFLNYSPSVIILNNIEFDHPDYFKSYNEVLDSFTELISRLTGKKILIVNQDDPGIKKLFIKLSKVKLDNMNVFGYTFSEKPLLDIPNSVRINIGKKNLEGTEFSVNLINHQPHSYYLGIPGVFNVANATGVIILAKIFNVPDPVIAKTLSGFKGIERRLELLGEKRDIKVYDDYAHHPTAIKATVSALRQKYPDGFIWVVDEPHSYSRTKALLKQYKGVFDQADRVIITPIFKARDKGTFGLREEDLIKSTDHRDIIFIDSFEKITSFISKNAKNEDIILVMGAGKSYNLARKVLANL